MVHTEDSGTIRLGNVFLAWNAWDEEDEAAEAEWEEFFRRKRKEVDEGKASQEWIDFFEDAERDAQSPPLF